MGVRYHEPLYVMVYGGPAWRLLPICTTKSALPPGRKNISDRLGTDLGTRLRETASNQCDWAQAVGHPTRLTSACATMRVGQNRWDTAHNHAIALDQPGS
jgi:hypothetical protein